jgi:hypothetical protein
LGPAQLQALPPVPPGRRCGCGQPVRSSHLEYLGRGQSVSIYICAGCGLAYRGAAGATAPKPAPRSRKPLPDGGHPENPVLDPGLAATLKELLDRG